MIREHFDITDEQAWLDARARDLTSTEVAALYDLSPYTSRFELWHRKRLTMAEAKPDTERMKWGRRLEAAIAAGVAEDNGWTAQPRKIYQRVPELRLGASFDWEAMHDGKLGLMEIKNVDRRIFDDQWNEIGDQIEAPPHIELQLQVQLLVSGLSWGAIIPLIGGNTSKVLLRTPDPQVAASIKGVVSAFWASIDAGVEPEADYAKDGEFIRSHLRNGSSGEIIKASDEMEADMEMLRDAQLRLSAAEEAVDALKAKLLYAAQSAGKVVGRCGTISCGYQEAVPPKFITPDMVGQPIGGRKGFRSFRFTPKKEK
jgi:putative phage-type endonuclease